MADLEFVFTVHLSADGRFDDMLRDLAKTVLRHAGCAESSILPIADETTSEVAAHCAGRSGCDVRFRAHGGAIHIDVTQGGRSVFHTSRRLP